MFWFFKLSWNRGFFAQCFTIGAGRVGSCLFEDAYCRVSSSFEPDLKEKCLLVSYGLTGAKNSSLFITSVIFFLLAL